MSASTELIEAYMAESERDGDVELWLQYVRMLSHYADWRHPENRPASLPVSEEFYLKLVGRSIDKHYTRGYELGPLGPHLTIRGVRVHPEVVLP